MIFFTSDQLYSMGEYLKKLSINQNIYFLILGRWGPRKTETFMEVIYKMHRWNHLCCGLSRFGTDGGSKNGTNENS